MHAYLIQFDLFSPVDAFQILCLREKGAWQLAALHMQKLCKLLGTSPSAANCNQHSKTFSTAKRKFSLTRKNYEKRLGKYRIEVSATDDAAPNLCVQSEQVGPIELVPPIRTWPVNVHDVMWSSYKWMKTGFILQSHIFIICWFIRSRRRFYFS